MKIRLNMDVGTLHGHVDVRRGDIVEVDDANGARYCSLGYAERVPEPKPERKVEPPVERAVVEESVETATLDVPADDDESESELPRPRPRSLDERRRQRQASPASRK